MKHFGRHESWTVLLSSSAAIAVSGFALAHASSPTPLQDQDQARPPANTYRPPTTSSTLRRHGARLYDVGIEMGFSGVSSSGRGRTVQWEADALVDDFWNLAKIDAASIVAAPNGIPGPVRVAPTSLNAGLWRIDAAAPAAGSTAIRWTVGWPVVSCSSEINEAEAARATWPRTWSPEDARFLDPSPYIDSEHPLFDEFVERVSSGGLRRVGPYLAAKDLVRHAILTFTEVGKHEVVHVDRPAIERSEPPCPNMPAEDRETARREAARAIQAAEQRGQLGGLALFNQASDVASWGKGTPPELLAVCIATLRAAGIPARPVIGIHDGSQGPGSPRSSRESLCAWGEFKLQGIGWVPFDPWVMRSAGLKQADVHRPWRAFGTISDLNRRPALFVGFPPIVVDRPSGSVHERPSVSGRTDRLVFDPTLHSWNRRPLINQFKTRLVLRGSGPTVDRLIR